MLMMISCLRASELMSQQHDRPLTMSEKVRLHMHLMICKSCQKTLEQFDILHRACQQYMEYPAANTENEVSLDDAAKQRIATKLEEQKSSSND